MCFFPHERNLLVTLRWCLKILWALLPGFFLCCCVRSFNYFLSLTCPCLSTTCIAILQFEFVVLFPKLPFRHTQKKRPWRFSSNLVLKSTGFFYVLLSLGNLEENLLVSQRIFIEWVSKYEVLIGIFPRESKGNQRMREMQNSRLRGQILIPENEDILIGLPHEAHKHKM